MLLGNFKKCVTRFQCILHWSGQENENICCGCSKMQFLAFSGRVKGQEMNPGSGKEATASWPDPFWFWGGLRASKETASVCAFPNGCCKSSPANPVEHPKPSGMLSSNTVYFHLLKASVLGLQSVWTFEPNSHCGTEFVKNADTQTF